MKKFFSLLITMVLLSPLVLAHPLSKSQMNEMKSQPTLRDQMDKMILSIADLDILVNRDKITDYEIFKEDAQRILDSLKKMREIDSTGIFKPYFDQLEKPTQQLLKYSTEKNPKAMAYPEKIFNACFKCHQANRNY